MINPKLILPWKSYLPESVEIYDQRRVEWVTAWNKQHKIQETHVFIDGVTFNDVVTTYTSTSLYIEKYTTGSILISTEWTSTPTDIYIELYFSDDNINWYKYMELGFADLRYTPAQGNKKECLKVDMLAHYVRITATATGSDASNTIKLTTKLVLNT